MKTFDDVRRFLGNIDYINCGGCGIAALAMYRWLKNNNQLKKSTKIVFFDNYKDSYNNNKNYIKKNNGKPEACSHVVLSFRNSYRRNYIDSVKLINKNDFYYMLIVTEEFLVESLNNFTTWSTAFKRRANVKKIEKELNIDLSDVLSNYSW